MQLKYITTRWHTGVRSDPELIGSLAGGVISNTQRRQAFRPFRRATFGKLSAR